MLSRIRAYGWTVAALLALALVLPAGVSARPRPGVTPPGGFRLFARSLGAMTVNRVVCGLGSSGRVCADSTNSSTIPGGFWPKGTPDQYVFNSGMQMGGIIGSDGGPWAGDTTGAFFFDSRGDLADGQEVAPIYNSQNSADLASWPAAANVPQNDRNSSTYFPLLQGEKAASQGDIWFLTWDGNPALKAGRKHPLGILVETRIMGWNYPAGNQDILYLAYTFYNVTTTNAADYAGVRPSLLPTLLQQAATFQAQNGAAYGVTLPAGGYTIKDFYANFSADMDVTPDAGNNYASVNLPYQLGYTYSSYFSAHSGTQGYPGDITSPPFMNGYGFVGVKYLASPINPLTNQQAGLSLFSVYENGGRFFDPGNAIQLYRYMSGKIDPAAGDGQCTNNPVTEHICFVENSGPNDMRFFQSSGPFDLPPGGSGQVVVAYLFAPAVKAGVCQAPNSGGCTNVKPGDPTLLNSIANLTSGNVNLVDSMTGYRGYAAGAETSPQQDHFIVTKGSLLDKANIAQLVFNGKFLLPVAPASPDFFLVPGDNQVAVYWRPSPTETSGDLYYQIAHSPVTLDSLGNPTAIPNPLYDPNYRQFDVEGYRVYRGRNQGSLTLLAQFDKAGTTISDYNGQINPDPKCAPDLNIFTTCAVGTKYDTLIAGTAQVHHVDHALIGTIVQVVFKTGRIKLADGTAYVIAADTAVTGAASGKFPPLADTGVPFVYLDHAALNNLRYFYAVTAFDVNSIQSGPSSLESAQNPKAATPYHASSNFSSTYTSTAPQLLGRGVDLATHVAAPPTLSATTGQFSGPAQATSNWSLGLAGSVVPQVLQGTISLAAQFDSVQLGGADAGVAHKYWFSSNGTPFSFSMVQSGTTGSSSGSAPFLGPNVNNARASLYGGNGSFQLAGTAGTGTTGLYYTNAQGRGCVNGAPGFADAGCDFNGARWFNGPSPAQNETMANPTAGNGPNGIYGDGPGQDALPNISNAGTLTGVDRIYEARSYQTVENIWRRVEGVMAGASHAADYNVYWGAAGHIDSIIDYTYNAPVPFNAKDIGASWGVLNPALFSGGTLRTYQIACAPSVKASSGNLENGGNCPVPATNFQFSQTAVPGPVVFNTGSGWANGTTWNTDAAQASNGFGLYIEGHFFQFELTGGALPGAGAVWSLRTYIGAIEGGTDGAGRNFGPYAFTSMASPWNAPGTQASVSITATNKVSSTTAGNLDAVHTVPDPYYVTSAYEVSSSSKIIKFVNLPTRAIIRIYSTSGVLVRLLEHNSPAASGEEDWDVRNRNNQVVASGVYFYSVESSSGPRVVKRLTIVNFAQ